MSGTRATSKLFSALALMAAVLLCNEARACRGVDFEQTVFFDEVPVGVDATTILDVVITDVSTTAEKYYWVGFARVERVIRGPVVGNTLKILVLPTSCTRGFGPGASGIVAGELRQDTHGTPELIAISESRYQQQKRKSSGK
jgi:hypothetical protein